MGRGAYWLTLAVSIFGAYLTLFMLVPFLSAVFIHRGFERFKVLDTSFKQCLQACFVAGSANLTAMIAMRFATASSEDSPIWPLILVYFGIQFLLVPLLIRKRSWQALLIEFGGIALANVCGIGLLIWLFGRPAQH
jgi:hypothetical protein